MNVVLVGVGPMAIAYAKVLDGLGATWSAVGRGAESAARFAAATGREPVRGGLASYLASSHVALEAAIVALPIRDLAGAARELIAAKASRVLIEKPAGLDAREIEEVARAAARSPAQVFVAYNRRFFASVAAAQKLIAEDGGVTSFQMEFTELEGRILKSISDPALLGNWFLANSSHVVDLAFFLGGAPVAAAGMTAGALHWHPPGGAFVGHGRTASGAIFTWHADWSSAGRWRIDLRTSRRRLILEPLETLAVQEKNSFAISPYPITDELDRQFKPGLYRQVEAFLSDAPSKTALPTIADHAETVRRWYGAICPSTTLPLPTLARVH